MAKPDNPSNDLPDVEDISTDEEHDDAALDDDLDPDTSDEGDDPEESDEDDDEGDDDEPLREEGKKALDRMKATVKDLKKTIRDLKAEIAEARKGSDEEVDELTSTKQERDAEREKRIETEKKLAAKVHGLPDTWADRLKGDDFDDFLDDAEALAADMPTPQNRKGGGGAKEGQRKAKEPTLDDKIAEAEKSGDHTTARRLKAQKVHDLRNAG